MANLTKEQRDQVLALLVEGLPVYEIARITGIYARAIAWIKKNQSGLILARQRERAGLAIDGTPRGEINLGPRVVQVPKRHERYLRAIRKPGRRAFVGLGTECEYFILRDDDGILCVMLQDVDGEWDRGQLRALGREFCALADLMGTMDKEGTG